MSVPLERWQLIQKLRGTGGRDRCKGELFVLDCSQVVVVAAEALAILNGDEPGLWMLGAWHEAEHTNFVLQLEVAQLLG